MSKEYDEYLKSHIENVRKAITWMRDNLPSHLLSDEEFDEICECHDFDKSLPGMYEPYDNYLYGVKPVDEKTKDEFNLACLEHIHRSLHHWQNWVLINDDGKHQAFEMPVCYILEMIADWWSFSWAKDDLYGIFDWYDTHKDGMILHGGTKDTVELILEDIRQKLDEQKAYTDGKEDSWIMRRFTTVV